MGRSTGSLPPADTRRLSRCRSRSTCAGRHDGARRCALAGAAAAIRPSSKRNALFIQGRVAAAMGEPARAESLCREAAAFPYRAQGGDGLLLWGDLLVRLERRGEAPEA